MRKVVISGATSMIGLALIDKCLKENVDILALVNKNSSRKGRIPKNKHIKVFECDMAKVNEINMREEFEENYEVFYHLAWAGTSHKGRQDTKIHLCNALYTLDIVDFAAKLGCKKFVGAGSQAEYGRKNIPLSGNTETNPEVPYGVAKLCAGQMSRIRCEQLGLEHVWTRILSAYGPYDNENTIIPTLIKASLKNEHFSTTEGNQIWELIYSEDVANALFLIGKSGVNGKVYPIGTGEARPLKEFLEIVKNKINSNIQLGYGEVPYGNRQIMHLEADISELTRDTGFMPRISFEEGIDRTIEYYKYRSDI